MNILITGSAGFLGSSIIKRLKEEKHYIKAIIRQEKQRKSLENLVDSFFMGDLLEAESLSGCAEGMDAIIHVAGKLGEFGIHDKVYKDIHVEGTRNILVECKKSKVKHFIHTGSAGVLGPLRDTPAHEDFPLNPSNIYERTKAEAETLVKEFCSSNGIQYSILRPEFVYGPRDTHVVGLFQAIKNRKFFLIGGGKTYLHPTYIDDVVESYILALKSKKSGKYLITGERAVTVRELSNIIANELGVPHTKISIPFSMALVCAKIFEVVCKYTRLKPPLSVSGVKFFCEHRYFNPIKAREELKYKPTVTLEEGIRRTISWQKEEGYL